MTINKTLRSGVLGLAFGLALAPVVLKASTPTFASAAEISGFLFLSRQALRNSTTPATPFLLAAALTSAATIGGHMSYDHLRGRPLFVVEEVPFHPETSRVSPNEMTHSL